MLNNIKVTDPGPDAVGHWSSASHVVREKGLGIFIAVELAEGETREVLFPKSLIEIWADDIRLWIRMPVWIFNRKRKQLEDAACFKGETGHYRQVYGAGEWLVEANDEFMESRIKQA